eukprot:TRINITY_DN7149_c0_g1_i1.p1 TRINITY_DN7149_c0_g1~~TRINITY_DN7149_c0_g1_i1.p1  ORF type:complete len:568 (+),score=216.67 TRINITY_DN7149_c0_g1_i1:3-1706(+)
MNILQCIHDYIFKMISTAPGLKALILDKETAGIVSLVFTKSQLLAQEVFLFSRLDLFGDDLPILPAVSAIVLIRPTPENFILLQNELRDPHFGEYHIFFTNNSRRESGCSLVELSAADEHETVKQVQEFYCDYFAISRDLFTLNIPSYISLDPAENQKIINRTCEGLFSILMSIRRCPVVRHQRNSQICDRISRELQRMVAAEPMLQSLNKKDKAPSLVLLIDRFNDPITPLLTQWTYRAMIHEILGFDNNRVDLSTVPNIAPEMQEVTLSSDNDQFYSKNVLSNFGDLAINLKQLLEQAQQDSKTNQKIESINDMKRFIESYSTYKQMTSNVAKHVTIVDAMSKIAQSRKLMAISELEQEIACENNMQLHYTNLIDFIKNPEYHQIDKLRLAMLYSIRYELSPKNNLSEIINCLNLNTELESKQIALIETINNYGGAHQRLGDLFNTPDFLTTIKNHVKVGWGEARNILALHKAHLIQLIELVANQRLSEQEYPAFGNLIREKPQDIIIFVVGGTTYGEAQQIAEINRKGEYGLRIILGGTTIHNSSSFISEIEKFRDLGSNYRRL